MYKQAASATTSVAVSEARRAFAEIVNRVAYGNERVTVVRHGREVVAIVPISDLRQLEAIAAGKRLTRPRSEPRS